MHGKQRSHLPTHLFSCVLQVLMLYLQLTVRYSKLLAGGPPHLIPKVNSKSVSHASLVRQYPIVIAAQARSDFGDSPDLVRRNDRALALVISLLWFTVGRHARGEGRPSPPTRVRHLKKQLHRRVGNEGYIRGLSDNLLSLLLVFSPDFWKGVLL